MMRAIVGLLVLGTACADPQIDIDPAAGGGGCTYCWGGGGSTPGGWDGNRGGWDGRRGDWDGARGGWGDNVVGWDGNAGVDPLTAAQWAIDGTGPGTLSNATLLGIEILPSDVASTPCGALTAGITQVQVRSSRGGPAAWTGPDVEIVEVGGVTRWLDEEETIVVRGRAHNGYRRYTNATFRITRLTTYFHANHPGNAWPSFHLEACKDGDPATGFTSIGVVSFMPFFRLPELPGEALVWHAGIVQPISIPYSTQPAALPLKFVANAGLPIAMAGEIALDPTGCLGGTRVSNREFVLAGALALGNASWVTPPLGERRFIAFFTKTGNPVKLFARIAGLGAEPVCVGGSLVHMLELGAADLLPEAADKLDAIATGNAAPHLPLFDHAAAVPTHLASGRSSFRRETYRDTSDHPDREDFLEQLAESIAATRLGTAFGEVQSQQALLTLLVGRADFVVAVQSPVPVEQEFDPPPPPGACGNGACEHDETCGSCAGDCPVCDVPPPWEVAAGPPAPMPGTDAGVGGVDAGVPGPDGGTATIDAGTGSGTGSGSSM